MVVLRGRNSVGAAKTRSRWRIEYITGKTILRFRAICDIVVVVSGRVLSETASGKELCLNAMRSDCAESIQKNDETVNENIVEKR